jgi:hypothetical protein
MRARSVSDDTRGGRAVRRSRWDRHAVDSRAGFLTKIRKWPHRMARLVNTIAAAQSVPGNSKPETQPARSSTVGEIVCSSARGGNTGRAESGGTGAATPSSRAGSCPRIWGVERRCTPGSAPPAVSNPLEKRRSVETRSNRRSEASQTCRGRSCRVAPRRFSPGEGGPHEVRRRPSDVSMEFVRLGVDRRVAERRGGVPGRRERGCLAG